ncbi:DUF2793 domain-containing protein, partial [Rhodopseudomonas sp. B29]|uniref:DUF2793 domain-containing protein n=1 Tax=Rhodopseudomonas sp. B29 TaxID=95607 RepID=UPI0003B4E0A5
MTDTTNLGLPLIAAGQAQKHVTHNEALQRLDALIQIAVADRSRSAPPASPIEGERHIVADGASGAWSGHVDAIAHFGAGGWDFITPAAGWCVWSIADNVLLVFDGAVWRDLRNLPVSLDNAARIGINTSADAANLLSVKSNAALFAAITGAEGGSGDVRLQLSKESAGKAASVVFSDAYSGRAEFGLVGSDAFKLKVSPDGAAWSEALVIDQVTGNVSLPRGLSLAGIAAPPPLTADHNDYAPAGLASAAVLQLSADVPRSVSGLGGGAEGRLICVINVGSETVTLVDEAAASAAANRFALGGNLAVAAKQAALLRYDGTAQRWYAIAGGRGGASAVTAPQGRLSLQSGAPVMTSAQAGRTTLYYTPYLGRTIPLYDGTAMKPVAFSELAAATTDTTVNPAAIGAGKVNDWFVWCDGGGTLRLSHGPDWSSDTARSAGTALQRVDGFLVNAVAIAGGPAAQRGTYVGTTRSNASAQFDWIPGSAAAGGGGAWFGVWNMYNRVAVETSVTDSTCKRTASASTAVEPFHASGPGGGLNNRVSFVSGLAEEGVGVRMSSYVLIAAASGSYGGFGFALDRTTTYERAASLGGVATSGNSGTISCSESYTPQLGFHYIQALQSSDGSHT